MKTILAILMFALAPVASMAHTPVTCAASPALGPGPSFTLNPNPVSGSFFYINLNFTEADFPDTRLVITNVLGQVVFTTSVKKTEFSLGRIRVELSDVKLDKGVYFVQLKSGESTKTQKLAIR
jgi:hypothetical protein